MIKIAKWLFLSLWFLCVIAFIGGQFLAPPDYHLLPGNPWGNLFGTSLVFGVIFFCLFVLFLVLEQPKKRKENKIIEKQNKYNLSLKRILSRLFLTGIIGIIFGIAMLPFMTVADELLFSQKVAIGGQNMIRMVVLWGIFTLIISLITFWRKHFRMVSVLLFVCWLISIVFLVTSNMYKANDYECKRSTPYKIPNEFNRSLDLISQRMGIDSTAQGSTWQSVFNYRNCLDIEYSNNDDKNTEAYFLKPTLNNAKNLQDLKIMVNPSYKQFDDLTLAFLLSHEIIHAGQFVNEVTFKTKLGCYESEANAFTAQQSFLTLLNQEEQRSIFTRDRKSVV